ncbi:MAG TPA: TonB-dependent receptor [Candidatus Acidoferrales bacterium]|jgi:iron complex outermembrane receptor protein|nr:TonB-dependent receptor [Candidatus Acidoferrales bacterium]
MRFSRLLRNKEFKRRIANADHSKGVRTALLRPMKILFAIIAGILCGQAVFAQQQPAPDLSQLSIEQLMKVKVETVYGASKFLQNVSDAPASVTIDTADEIQRYGYRTLAEILASARGFYVIYDRNYTYVGVRGFSRPSDYNARILFLIDGHRENDNIFDGAYVGTAFPIDVDLIDHVEIIRGPGSAVYGTGAVIAVINVVTRRGRDLNGWEVSGQGGSWGTYKARVSYGTRFRNNIETLISASFYNSAGHDRLFYPEFDSPATNNGIAENADADQYYDIFGELIRGDFTLHVVANSRTKHIPTASFGTVFDDPRTKTTDERRYVDIQYAHSLASQWDILARASYDWYGYRGIYITDYSGDNIPPFVKNIDVASGNWSNFEFDASHVFYRHHHVTAGAEFRDDFTQYQENYDQQPYTLYLNNSASQKNAAYYVQDNFSIRKNLIVVGGMRSDWYEQFGTTYSPRAGLIFVPRTGTRIKLMYNKAFRAPNRFEEFYVSGNSNEANPLLQPERIVSYETEVDQELGKKLRLVGVVFLNDLDQVIEADLNPSTGHVEFGNTGFQNSRGLEIELQGQWKHGLLADASYSFQNSSDPNRQPISNSPHNLAKARISAPLWRQKLSISFEGQYYSRMSTLDGPILGGYALANATLLARRILPNLDFSANVENLFDKRYAESGGLEHQEVSIPQDGRSIRAKLAYRFSSR